MSTLGIVLVFLGIFLAPVMTLSLILFWLGHPVLGIIALIVSFLRAIGSKS